MRLWVLVAVLACACGGVEPEPVALTLHLHNNSDRAMQCRAGYIVNLIRQPEAMSDFTRLDPNSINEFVFFVPHGDFATVAAECQALDYPRTSRYVNTSVTTDALTASFECTSVYAEPNGLSEFDTTCSGGVQ